MYYRPRNPRQGGMTNYLMPFLIIICVGIIVVLIFNLWKAVTAEDVKKAAYMHFIQGNAQMKTWGTTDFFNLTSDALIMQGDEIVSSSNAKIIIEFFDGTIMRIDGKTDISFSEIDENGNPPSVTLLLVNGKAWFNKLYRSTGSTVITIKTSNLAVKSENGSIFEIENAMDEAVRVMNGNDANVSVDVYDKDGAKVVETEKVGVGQEIVFTDAVLDKYWQFQSPSVIAAISPDFRADPWVAWNEAEDKAPTQFEKSVNGGSLVKVDPQAVTAPVVTGADSGTMVPQVGPDGQPLPADGATGTVPTATTDTTGTGISAPPGSTTGTTTTGGVSTPPSSGTGMTGTGISAPPGSTTTTTPTTTTPAVTPPATTTVSVAKPTVKSVGKVLAPDAGGFYVVTEPVVTISGGAGTGVTGVSVNGYALKKFKAGDTTWNYFANANYGLMKEGENTYEIYATDANGNKSQSVLIKVLYKPETPVTTTTTTNNNEALGTIPTPKQ